jgi:hypothetical protein
MSSDLLGQKLSADYEQNQPDLEAEGASFIDYRYPQQIGLPGNQENPYIGSTTIGAGINYPAEYPLFGAKIQEIWQIS